MEFIFSSYSYIQYFAKLCGTSLLSETSTDFRASSSSGNNTKGSEALHCMIAKLKVIILIFGH